MADPLIGAYAAHGYSGTDEGTYGTAATIDRWKRVITPGLRRVRTKEVTGEMAGYGAVSAVSPLWFVTSDIVRGSFTTKLCYDDATLLLCRHALRKAFATTGPVSTKYTHTGTLGLPSAFVGGLTIEEIKGRRGSSIDAELYAGGVMARTTIRIANGQLSTLSFDVIAASSGGRTTPTGTPTFATGGGAPVLFQHGGSFTWNSVNDKIKSLEITIDQKLDVEAYIGSLSTSLPMPTAPPEVTWRVTRKKDENTAYAAYLADTQGNAAITFTGSGDNTLVLQLDNAICVDDDDNPRNAGKTDETITLMGVPDATDSGFSMVFTNSNSSALANGPA